jgi:TolB-like protein/DNA-binding winged helix-turn-helix (wHTH) protein
VLRIGGAVADLRDGRVTAPDGTVTELRPQSAAVLRALAARSGETVSKGALLDEVWAGIAVTEDSLVQCIGDIRRALGGARDALRTLPKRGYRLDPDAAPAPARRRRRTLLAVCAGMLCAALVALALWQRLQAPAVLPAFEGPVVAVLPFENLSEPGRWDRLARGVTEEVIADLATNPWLFVLADATTRPHAGETPQAVGKALGVGHVVTGTLQKQDGRVRIAAALSDPRSGRQVWTRQWEGPADDILVLQTAAAEALVGELAGHWSGAIALADRARAHEASTRDLDAYDLYLLGIESKHRMTPEGFDRAEDYLLRAVAIDPDFARAWVGLSIVMGFKASSTGDAAEAAALNARLQEYAARAVAADPDDPSVLLQAGWAASLDGDLEAADRSIRRAVEQAPNDADVLAVAAWSSPGGAGIKDEANAWADRAFALNPAAPGWYLQAKGSAAFAAGDYRAAVVALRAAPPDFAERAFFLAAAEGMLGETAAARAAADELRAMVPGFDLERYVQTWQEPGLQQRLRDGAVRAGLGTGG